MSQNSPPERFLSLRRLIVVTNPSRSGSNCAGRRHAHDHRHGSLRRWLMSSHRGLVHRISSGGAHDSVSRTTNRAVVCRAIDQVQVRPPSQLCLLSKGTVYLCFLLGPSAKVCRRAVKSLLFYDQRAGLRICHGFCAKAPVLFGLGLLRHT